MWPTPQDYNEAIQNPGQCFGDADLQDSLPETTHLGLPKPTSGSFASVYHMQGSSGEWAVRCFLHNFPDLGARYDRINEFLQTQPSAYTVPFQFINEGIQLNGGWYPILKMEWVHGEGMIPWLERHLRQPVCIDELCDSFSRMCRTLTNEGIAHGDLQHGNLLLVDDRLKLVDYDAMFVPELRDWISNEIGHRHYQHPMRDSSHFDSWLDNFSARSIYTSLFCLTRDPRLWQKLGAGDDCLLFKQEDYLNPINSVAFRALENHDMEEVRDAARSFRGMLELAPEAVPPLGVETSEPIVLRELEPPLLLPNWIRQSPAPDDTSLRSIDSGQDASPSLRPVSFMDSPIPNLRLVAQDARVEENVPRLVTDQTDYASATPRVIPHNKPRARKTFGIPKAIQNASQYSNSSAPSYQQGKQVLVVCGLGLLLIVSALLTIVLNHNPKLSFMDTKVESPYQGHYAVNIPINVPFGDTPNFTGYEAYSNGLRYLDGRRIDDAKNYFLNALSIYDRLSKDSVEAAICRYELAKCEMLQQKPTAAIGDMLQTEQTFRKNDITVSSLFTDIGACYEKLGHYEQAAHYFDQAVTNALATNNEPDIKQNQRRLRLVAFELLSRSQKNGLEYFRSVEVPDDSGAPPSDVRGDLISLARIAAKLERQKAYDMAFEVRTLQFETANTYPDPHFTTSIEALEGLRLNAMLRREFGDAQAFEAQLKELQRSNVSHGKPDLQQDRFERLRRLKTEKGS